MSDKAPAKANTAPKRQVLRGPKWPAFNVTDALNKSKVIYSFEKKSPTTADVMLGHLGFKTRTGPANRTLAALRQYGLLEKKGKLYHISDSAWKIFILPENDPERQQLIRSLALKPALFRELVALYSDGLPSDATLRSYLILNKGFNENTVGRLINIFKANVDIAKPYEKGYSLGDSASDDEDDYEEEGEEVEIPTAQEQNRKVSPIPPANRGQGGGATPEPPAGMHFPIYLLNGKQAALYVPSAMSKREWELLKKQVEHHLMIAEATALVEDEPSSPPLRVEAKSEEE